MVATPALGMDVTQIGLMTSIFPLAYGFSKFVSGVLGSLMSASKLLGLGLIATSLINIGFGYQTSMTWFCVLWAMNGLLQGIGGPCCARILTTWFASKERGTYWGMWNIAHNLGGFAAPLIAGSAASRFGWSWGMWVPGMIGVAFGSVILLGMRETPEAAGFPPVEADPAPPAPPGAEGEAAAGAPKQGLKEILVDTVLKNPYIWGMAFTYFFIYIIRQGVTSWFVFYMIQEKGAVDAAAAAARVSGMELGGLVGSLLAGRISDYMVNSAAEGEGAVGKRVQVVMAYTVGVAAMLLAFWACPAGAGALQWSLVFMIGFFLYGPQMLIGLCGAEMVGPAAVGASEGFLGYVAYLGAANAGAPLAYIVREYGWTSYFGTLLVACALALVLLAPMRNLPNWTQKVARGEAV